MNWLAGRRVGLGPLAVGFDDAGNPHVALQPGAEQPQPEAVVRIAAQAHAQLTEQLAVLTAWLSAVTQPPPSILIAPPGAVPKIHGQ